MLLGAGAAVCVAGLAAGAGPALRVAARLGATLGVAIMLVNVLVTTRGETLLVRGWELPILGDTGITLEALAAGGVLALRITVVIAAFAVYSACVDPDRVLRLLRPIARRSALTATLVSRAVPLAAADLSRLREAASLRGPAAAPATRAVLAGRLLAGVARPFGRRRRDARAARLLLAGPWRAGARPPLAPRPHLPRDRRRDRRPRRRGPDRRRRRLRAVSRRSSWTRASRPSRSRSPCRCSPRCRSR